MADTVGAANHGKGLLPPTLPCPTMWEAGGSMESILRTANILVTGGAGTLGRAIARRRKEEGWAGKFTVYSTDEHKHAAMRSLYPDINYICGDIRNPQTLFNAMVGHDVVIHAAAVKVIPISEIDSIDTCYVNVTGSEIVCSCAIQARVKKVLGISTDKACHPANAYGATKMLMEKIFHEFSRIPGIETEYNLVRYGNVLESNGSVVQVWKRMISNGDRIRITSPSMTRFWLSPSQAVQYVEDALRFSNGLTYIPKMPALSIYKLAEYSLGEAAASDHIQIPLRPGEKMHETLLTEEEGFYTVCGEKADFFLLTPTTDKRKSKGCEPYTSNNPDHELTKDELLTLLENG